MRIKFSTLHPFVQAEIAALLAGESCKEVLVLPALRTWHTGGVDGTLSVSRMVGGYAALQAARGGWWRVVVAENVLHSLFCPPSIEAGAYPRGENSYVRTVNGNSLYRAIEAARLGFVGEDLPTEDEIRERYKGVGRYPVPSHVFYRHEQPRAGFKCENDDTYPSPVYGRHLR